MFAEFWLGQLTAPHVAALFEFRPNSTELKHHVPSNLLVDNKNANYSVMIDEYIESDICSRHMVGIRIYMILRSLFRPSSTTQSSKQSTKFYSNTLEFTSFYFFIT